jgi:branched-chain amino acid transport system substrate-binding protein
MRHRTWLRIGAAAGALTLLAAACGDDDDDEAEEPEETTTTEGDEAAPTGDGLVIGTLLPESGDLSSIIDSLRVPIDLAVEEINENGGVLGADVEVVGADDGTDDLTVASSSFDRLVNTEGVPAILGPASSDLNEGLMSDIAGNDVVVCTGSATSAAIQDLPDEDHHFQFPPNDNLQGPALAEVVNNDGHGSVAIEVRNDAYGTGFGDALAAALEDVGVEVVLNEAYDPEADSFTAEAGRIADANADAVVIIGFEEGGQLIADMIEAGIGPDALPIYTADGMQGSTFWENVGSEPSVVEGIKGTAPAAAPEGVEHPFQEAFAETGVDTIFSSYYYDCAITMALAVESAGSTEPAAVSEAVFAVTSGDNECVGYAECKEFLDAGETINVQGASGDLELNENGAVTSGAYDVWEYDAEGAPVNLDEPQVVLEL